jgi:hypothetical protein
VKPLHALAGLSVWLLAARLYAATRVGFGDAEALYAAYALVPQPSYLDHPGLVGSIARLIGGGTAPSPLATHLVTAVTATLVPWIATLSARAAGAETERAPIAGLALVAAPEISVGLFGLTPDLVLAPLWLGCLGATSFALRSAVSSTRALFAFLVAGALAGLAADGKISGLLLFPVLLAAPLRTPHARSFGPWLGLALGALLFFPVAAFEAQHGFPMLVHRLVATQSTAGLSLRNAGALVGGQLAYLSPVLAVLAALALRDVARRPSDFVARFLRLATLVPLVPLALLCLWSRVAEPHWIAPALLALPLHVARRKPFLPDRWTRVALPIGLVMTAIAHVWALTDLAPRFLGRAYEARYDLANDLFATPALVAAVAEAREDAIERTGVPSIVVARHWTIAAQMAAGSRTLVATPGDVSDDFSRWVPRASWERRPAIVWVTDDRFDAEIPRDRAVAREIEVPLVRGGRVVRRATVRVLVRTGGA